MNKAHRSILFVCLGIVIVLLILFFISVQSSKRIIFFYGNDCPHCKNVESYLLENNVSIQSIMEWEEISDSDNQQMLARVAKLCGLKPAPQNISSQNICAAGGSTSCSTGGIDIPVLYVENHCYVGDTAIIDYVNSTWSSDLSKNPSRIGT